MPPANALPAELTGHRPARGGITADRNLGLDLVRVTEAAAPAAGRWARRGEKELGDRAAVEAMRHILGAIDMDGVVVIGEGAKDEASLLADGRPDSIAVIGVAPRGTMWSPGPAYSG